MRGMTSALTASRASLPAVVLILGLLLCPSASQAKDKLLDEAVDFTGTMLFLDSKVPGLVIGAVRNGETTVAGVGKIRDGSDQAPDGKTLVRIGSITKAFTGAVLASMVADGSVRFTDPLQRRLGWDVKIPQKDGKEIRLIDLANRYNALPQEAQRAPTHTDNP